jgi:hypothetical protein
MRVGSWSCDWGIGRIQPKGRIFIGSHSLPPSLVARIGPSDDLFGIRPVAPTSHCPNVDVGIQDGQQRNVIIVAVIKPVPPRNVVEILLDEVAQPTQVVVLPSAIRG